MLSRFGTGQVEHEQKGDTLSFSGELNSHVCEASQSDGG